MDQVNRKGLSKIFARWKGIHWEVSGEGVQRLYSERRIYVIRIMYGCTVGVWEQFKFFGLHFSWQVLSVLLSVYLYLCLLP